jgi:hypothetical protein
LGHPGRSWLSLAPCLQPGEPAPKRASPVSTRILRAPTAYGVSSVRSAVGFPLSVPKAQGALVDRAECCLGLEVMARACHCHCREEGEDFCLHSSELVKNTMPQADALHLARDSRQLGATLVWLKRFPILNPALSAARGSNFSDTPSYKWRDFRVVCFNFSEFLCRSAQPDGHFNRPS